jgi:transcriptional regulator with XRE-family HTH domain
MSVGARVKFAREYLGLKQPEFAERLGVKQSYLSYVENDKRKPSEKFLVAMYINFKINAEWVVKGIGQVIDGVDVEVPEQPKRLPQDADIMTLVIQAVTEYSLSRNLSLAPNVTARVILSFYQYFCDADKVTYSDVKKAVEQSTNVVINAIGVKK